MSRAILIFDGICCLCNRAVDLIIRADDKNCIIFGPSQTEESVRILKSFGMIPESIDGVVLVDGESVYSKSDAVLRVAQILGGVWNVVVWPLRLVPRRVRDYVYDMIARNRYRWFGRRNICRVPGVNEKHRFLS